MSVFHSAILVSLFGLLFCWGDSSDPPSMWITTPVLLLFTILTPLTLVISFFDHHIVRVPDACFFISGIASALMWWSLIAWLVIKRTIPKTKSKGSEYQGKRK